MPKDFKLSGDINTDSRTDDCDKSSDFNGDLARDNGVDLNAEADNNSDSNKNSSIKKAALFIPSPPPPKLPEAPPIIEVMPETKNPTPLQEALNFNETIQEGDPAPDNRDISEQASLDTESVENSDPPEISPLDQQINESLQQFDPHSGEIPTITIPYNEDDQIIEDNKEEGE